MSFFGKLNAYSCVWDWEGRSSVRGVVVVLFCSDDLGFGFDKQLRNAITEVFAAEIAETLATNPGIKIEPVEPAPNSSDRPMLALTDAGNDCDEEIDNEDQVDTDNGDVSLEGELGFQMSLPPALRQFGGGGGGREAKWGTQCRGSPAWLLGVIIAPTYDLIMVSIAPVLLHAASGDFAAWF